jgi:hypothetical protein
VHLLHRRWSEGRRSALAEVLFRYPTRVPGEDGTEYAVQACGAEAANGLWHGWLEFIGPDGNAVRSARETTQPNFTDAQYWATGLTPVYLEGALRRAIRPRVARPTPPDPEPVYDAPAPDVAPPPGPAESILNPFSVYEKGEALLRRQLRALSAWHLANIVRAYDLGDGSDPNRLPAGVLIEQIVTAVKRRLHATRKNK